MKINENRKIKTLSQLKKDAQTEEYEAKVTEFRGGKNIPENMKEWRKLSWHGGLKFTDKDGESSYEEVKYSSLIDYTDNILILYFSTYRNSRERGEKVLVYELRKIKGA